MESNSTESGERACAIDPKAVWLMPNQNVEGIDAAAIVGAGTIIADATMHNEEDEEDLDTIERWATIKHDEDKHQWRKLYLGRSFYLVGYVLYISLSFLLFSAIGLFTISDNVLIALLTTMVANVLGVLAIAFHWLYQK